MNKAEELADFLEARIQLHISSSDHQLVSHADANIAAELRRLSAENAELRGSLKRANSLAEEFERKWYLQGDELEALRARLDAIYSTEPAAWTHCDFGSTELSRVRRVGWTPLIPLPEKS
jgi:hypothetical protein